MGLGLRLPIFIQPLTLLAASVVQKFDRYREDFVSDAQCWQRHRAGEILL